MKLKIFAAALMLTAAVASAACAADIDYQEFQEDPLETAIRKLASPEGGAWDREVMLSGGAPDIVQEVIWPLREGYLGRGMPLREGYLGRGIKRKGRRHDGVDMSAPRGTPIYAVLDGIVEVVSNNGPGFRGYGRVIVINHGGRLWSLYSHNSANYVKVGQRVKQGDKIAAVGRTGRATGNHLHFELRNAKGTPLDPMKYLPKEGRLPRK